MTLLSPHFTLEEMIFSQEAARRDISNYPDEAVLDALRSTALRMETVRMVLDGKPIHVSSGYRCERVNRLIGGVSTSAHVKGWAVDFTCPEFGSTFEVAMAIKRSSIAYDQVILEYGWVHISFDHRLRMQVLTKRSARAPYETGLKE